MKKGIVLLLLGLALTGPGPAEAETLLPWSKVADLEGDVTQAYPVAGCSDAPPMALYVIEHGADTYHLVVGSDARWAIIGPAGPHGARPIWYGTIEDGERLVIERALVGTSRTDVCPFLVRSAV
jgi:hypothetical protein